MAKHPEWPAELMQLSFMRKPVHDRSLASYGVEKGSCLSFGYKNSR